MTVYLNLVTILLTLTPMTMDKEKLEKEFEELYDRILDGFEDWDYTDLDRLLELHLMLNKKE